MPDTSNVWVLTNHGWGSKPFITQYALHKKTAKGVTVIQRAGKRVILPSQSTSIFFTEEEAKKRWWEIMWDQKMKLMSSLEERTRMMEEGARIEIIPATSWPKVDLKL